MTPDLLSIDPGVKTVWIASWYRGALVQAQGIKVGGPDDLVRAWAWGPTELAIEVPQVYPGAKAEDPNDLIDLSIVVGWCEVLAQARATRYRPRQWKGQTPKKIDNQRTLETLSPAELLVLDRCGVSQGKVHNILDAVGIGLKHLRRR